MNEEYVRILKMIEEGKVSAEEGAELIKSLGNGEGDGAGAGAGAEGTGGDGVGGGLLRGGRGLRGRRLRIKVTDLDTGKNKVNIRIPLKLARLAEKMIPGEAKAEMREQGIDLGEIISNIDELGDEGPLVDIDADDNGKEHVNISIYVE